jgi:glycoside/pentoside/hexuronide:cation symporter, GPH family
VPILSKYLGNIDWATFSIAIDGFSIKFLYETINDGPNLSKGYQLAMGLMALIGTLLFVFCFSTTKERVEHVVDKKPLFDQFKLLLNNGQWTLLFGVCFIGTVGYVIRNSVAIYYAKYFLGGDAEVQATFLGTGVVAAMLAMVASTYITKYYCKVKLFKWSQLAVGVISLALLVFVRPGDIYLAFPLYFLLSFVVDLHAPVFWSAIAEAVDYGHAKTGKRVSGLAFGGISFAQKLGMGIAGGAVGLLLHLFDYIPQEEVQSDFTLWGLALMLTVIPGLFHTIMGALMFRYKITDEYYEGIKTKLKI